MRKLAYFSSLLVIFTIPWEEAFTIGSFGTVTRIVGLLTMILWLGALLVTGKIRKLNGFYLMAFLFIVWNIMSLIWSVDLEQSQQQVITYIQLGVLALILWDLYTTENTLKTGMQAYILGSYVTIISTIINRIRDQQIYLYSGGRYAGAGLNAVDLALTLSLGLPIAWYLAISTDKNGKSRILAILNYMFIPSALFAIILTGSRTALFAAIPALIYIFSTFKRFRMFNRVIIFIGLVGTLIVVQLSIPSSSFDRFSTTASSILTGDLGGRVSLWQAAMSIFQENPIIGIGSGALSSPLELGTVAHNTYISVLTELGLFGLCLYTAVLIIVLFTALRQSKPYSDVWLAVFMVWLIGVLSLTWEYRKTTWLIMSMIVISANVYQPSVVKNVIRDYFNNSPASKILQHNVPER